MVTASEPRGEGFRRLHPASLPIRVVGLGRVWLLPGLLALFAISRSDSDWERWAMIAFVPALLFEVLRFLTLRYRCGETELVIVQHLVVWSRERHVPFGRIQNLDLTQSVLHRLLRVADVRIETAGGSEPEAVLSAVSLGEVERLRSRIFGAAAARRAATGDDDGTAAAEPEGRELATLSTVDLVRLGLVANRGLVVLSFVFYLAWEADLLGAEAIAGRLEDFDVPLQGPILWLLGTWVFLALVVLLVGFSIVWTILRFGGYRLEEHGEDLRMRCGLLTHHAATIPRRRVQLVCLRQSMIHRWMERATVRVETAGGVGEGDQDESRLLSRTWFLPIAPVPSLPPILATVHETFEDLGGELRPLHPKARIRMARKALAFSVLVAIGITAAIRPWGLMAFLVLPPMAWWWSGLWVRRAGWAADDRRAVFQSGVLVVRRTIVPVEKCQVVSVRESPFDRRHGHATLVVDTAGAGPAGHRVRVPYLGRDDARAAARRLAEHAERVDWTAELRGRSDAKDRAEEGPPPRTDADQTSRTPSNSPGAVGNDDSTVPASE